MTANAKIPPPHIPPFPAGPLLRPGTADACALTATEDQRIRLALAVLRREHQAVTDKKEMGQPNSKLTKLIARSVLEWVVVHEPQRVEQLASDRGNDHPATELLEQWHAADQTRSTDSFDADVDAVHFFAANLDLRWRLRYDSLPQPSQVDAPSRAPAAEASPDAPATGSPDPGVDAVLAEPRGGKRLLAHLFLKLVYIHLAWLPSQGHSSLHKAGLYDPVQQLLIRIARSCGSHSPTAVGLVRELPRIVPYWEPAAAGAPLPNDLPDCFRPEFLSPPEQVVRQARAMLVHRPELHRQVCAVEALARDTAALMTDLATQPGLGLTATQHAQRGQRLENVRKRWKAALEHGGAEDLAGLRTSKNFARDGLLPRLGQVKTLSLWMARRGWEFVRDAAAENGIKASPQPLGLAPARPAPGATA